MDIKLDDLWKMELNAGTIKFHYADEHIYSRIVEILE